MKELAPVLLTQGGQVWKEKGKLGVMEKISFINKKNEEDGEQKVDQ